MSMEDYEEALALIAAHVDDADFEPQPAHRVIRAEQALKVTFPPTYRRFLLELGAVGLGSEEIYGVINDDFEDARPPQAVGLTLRFRGQGQIPDGLVVIYNLGQGSYFAIDTERVGPDGEAPVVKLTPGLTAVGDELEVVAADFGAFLAKIVRDEIG